MTMQEKFKNYYETKSLKLREEIIIENISLAFFVVNKLAIKYNLKKSEIESYAFEGLIMAVDNFNPYLGYQFSTYAYPIMKGKILNGIHSIFSYEKQSFYTTFIKVKKVIEQEFLTTISNDPELISEAVDYLINKKELQLKNREKIIKKILFCYPENIDNYIEEQYFPLNSYNCEEYLSNDYINDELCEDNNLYLSINKTLFIDSLNKIKSQLSDRQFEIIKKRYGLLDGIIYTLTELSEEMNLSIEGVRKMENAALKILGKEKNKNKLSEFLENIEDYNYRLEKIIK